MPELPSGTVTFLFTDIEGSTALWERDQAAMAAAVARHLTLLRAATERCGGVLFKVVGDAVQSAFPTAPDGVAAALEAQQALSREAWPENVGPLRVRMALHTAAATPRDGDYLAPGLNRLSRLLAAGHGGQILLSLATQDLARDALPPGVSLRDLGEHPLRDLYRPERVFQLLHPNIPADFPVLRTLATRPNNLPLQPTPFLGREEQVANVVDLVSREDVRLLTITGPGGVGKTRLALQVAADLLEDFPDGAWFVDLSVLDDPALVLSTIAAVLGVREEGSRLTERLVGILSRKRLLLVLDNFERVIDDVQSVSDLLGQVPGLNVLATSRIPLHAYGEREYPLAPLPLPDPSHLPPVQAMSQYEAVRLFIERAQAVKPDFTVTTANAPAVAEICFRLDGLPLAIELASALVKVLPPQALLKRLEQRLPLLTGGARTLPARQQTMRNAIAWGHDLLTADEQTLFRRLAAFSGDCTLEAAEVVAAGDGTLEVFSGIASLVDKSLLRQAEGIEGEPRFRMLETVREYGQERLASSGEMEETRRRLAEWCLTLAEEVRPDFLGGTLPPRSVLRLHEELPNLRAAVTWLLDRGEAAKVLRLLAATEDYWTQQHTSDAELRRWLEIALAAAPDTPASDRAVAHWMLIMLHALWGRNEEAGVQAQQALIAAQTAGEPFLRGLIHYAVGMSGEARGDLERAAAAYAEAIALMREAGSEPHVWLFQAALADTLIRRGDLEAGVPMLDEALERLRQVSSEWLVGMVIAHRGHAALLQGNLPGAARWLTVTIDLAQTPQRPQALLRAVRGLAGVALALGQAERAARLLGADEAAREALGLGHVPQSYYAERITTNTRAALDASALEQSWAAGRLLPLEAAVREALAVADEVLTGAKG